MSKAWLKDGKLILGDDGKAVLCDECPCGELTCQEQVDAAVDALIEADPTWSRVKTKTCTFQCARWSYDETTQEWTLVRKASGTLVVRSCTNDVQYLFTTCDGHTCTYAVEVANSDTGTHRVYYCSCSTSETTGECEASMGYGDGRIMGTLPVVDKTEEEYTFADSCAVDLCDIARLKITHAQAWIGGTSYGEGYYDHWGASQTLADYSYTAFGGALKYTVGGTEYLATIPCECTDQYLSVMTLPSGYQVHGMDGACELEGTCALQLLYTNRYLMEDGWTEVSRMGASYSCEDSSGNLVVVANRPSSSASLDCVSYYTFTSAATLLKDGAYRTIGCRCTGTCEQTFTTLDSYGIAGKATVTSGCSVDACEALSTILSAWASWYGGTLWGEGFKETIDQTSHGYSFMTFSQCMSLDDSGVTTYWYVPCTCSSWQSMCSYTLSAGETLHSASGICSASCQAVVALAQSATDHGWDWHGEGRLYHLDYYSEWDSSTGITTYTYGTWYDIDMGNTALGCAITSDGIAYAVSCSCSVVCYSRPDSSAPSDYWMYLDISGACTCYDDRQILLQNPTEFGVIDIQYGSNSKYKYAGAYYGRVCSFSQAESGDSTRWDHYLDYRTFCVIYRKYSSATAKLRLRYISPSGSPVGSGVAGTYDQCEFAGYVEPFEKDTDFNPTGDWWYTGIQVEWDWHNTSPGGSCGWTEAEAKAKSEEPPVNSADVIATRLYGLPYSMTRVSPPETTQTLVQGSYWRASSGWWCYSPQYYRMGVQRTVSAGVIYVCYREQWIQTNKGILRYGSSSYESSFTLYGYQGSYGDPSWTGYCSGHCPTSQDTTITATLIDEDMHGCSSDDDWDWSESE